MRARLKLLVLIVGVSGSSSAAVQNWSQKLQPAESIKRLSDAEKVDFIVRGSVSALSAARELSPSPDDFELSFISAIGVTLTIEQASSLARREDVEQIWYVPASLYPTYCRIVNSIAYAFRNNPRPSIVNISLGPPADVMPLAPNDDEPMNAATKKAVDNGLILIMAIGNYFDGDNAGTVNPWCRPQWMICVGAASADASRVWAGSARGSLSDPATWPTVVAFGIDVISAWPTYLTKSADRQQHDESNPEFRKAVPKKDWPVFTLESGTSQATAQVSRAAVQIVTFVREAAARKTNVQADDRLFSITVPRERMESSAKAGPRLTGELHPVPGSTDTEIVYRLVDPWRLVKQLLIDTAVPMPDLPPSAVGAGFVDPAYVEKQFKTDKPPSIEIEPLKVL